MLADRQGDGEVGDGEEDTAVWEDVENRETGLISSISSRSNISLVHERQVTSSAGTVRMN